MCACVCAGLGGAAGPGRATCIEDGWSGRGERTRSGCKSPGKAARPCMDGAERLCACPSPRDGVQTCVPTSVLKPTVVAVGGEAEGLGVQRWAHGGPGRRGWLSRPALRCLGAAHQDGTRGSKAGTPCSGRGAASLRLWRMPAVNQGARPDLGRRLEADPQVRAGGHGALRAAQAPLCTAPSAPPRLTEGGGGNSGC